MPDRSSAPVLLQPARRHARRPANGPKMAKSCMEDNRAACVAASQSTPLSSPRVPLAPIRSRQRSAHGRIAVLSHQARRRRARQSHRRRADVPVQRHGRLRQRLAHRPSRHARQFRGRPRRRRGDPCGASRAHHPWLPRPLFGRLRADAEARHRRRPALRHHQVRHPARPCRTQGVLAAPLGGRRRAQSGRGPLGDHRRPRPCRSVPAGTCRGR